MTDAVEVVDISSVKQDGDDDVEQPRVINGPAAEKLEIDDFPMSTAVTTTSPAATAVGTAGPRPRRRCLPCRCTRYTAAVLGLVLLSLVLAILLIVTVIRLSQRPSTCAVDHDDVPGQLTDGPGRVLSDLADDGTPLPWTDIRLPRTVVPVSYSLQLRVDPSRDWFHGAVDINVTVNDDTLMIVLHASSLDVGGTDNIRLTHQVGLNTAVDYTLSPEMHLNYPTNLVDCFTFQNK